MSDYSTKRGSVRKIILLITLFVITALFALSLSVPLSPTASAVKTAGFLITGRLHFPKDRLGSNVLDESGKRFTIFREVVVDPGPDQSKNSGAKLILHFQVTNMTQDQNKFYSQLVLPLYIGDRGFRRKLFTINGQYCQSIYEWDTEQDARNYLKSYAVKTITSRSVKGSFKYEIKNK